MAVTSRTRLQQILNAGSEAGGIQVRVSGRHGPVGIYPLSAEHPHASLDEILDTMRECAVGRTAYSVSVHSEDGETLVATSLAVDAKDASVTPADAERDPVVAHLLRHQDAILGQQTKALAGLLDHYRTALEGARARTAELETTLERLRATYEEAVSLRYEREALQRDADRRAEREDRAIAAILSVGSAIVQKKMGVTIPDTPSVSSGNPKPGVPSDPLSALLRSLTSEQMDRIAECLSPEQIDMLAKAVP